MLATKTDAQIQRDVLQELKWDTRVEETDVGVEVDNGAVTLTGTVGSYAKKLAAREAAHRVIGVLDVADDVQVHLPSTGKHTDTELAQAVRGALTWDALVPEERIRSTVSDGWVTLEGEVDRWAQREDAERAVSRLMGVRGVINHIQVKAQQVRPEIVRDTIEKALERRAVREARDVKIGVEDGTVTLSGEVQNWPERQAILQAVAHAPGVRSVKDELRVYESKPGGGW